MIGNHQGRSGLIVRSALALAAAFTLIAPAVHAQYPTGSIKGRLQVESDMSNINTKNTAGGDSTINTTLSNNVFLRRAYVEWAGTFAANIKGKIEVAVARKAVNLEDAYIDIGLGQYTTWRVGQEKKPIERQELNSSNSYLTIERGAANIGGLKNNNLISQNNFLVAIGTTSHDIGSSIEFHNLATAKMPMSFRVGAWDGNGKDNAETNNSKTYGFRYTITPIKQLQLGAAWVSHDDVITKGAAVAVDSTERTTGLGIDGEWGNFDSGLHIMGDFASGKESRVGAMTATIAALRSPAVTGTDLLTFEPKFTTLHVAGEYKMLLDNNAYIQAIGPVLRYDHTSPDTDTKELASTLTTIGANIYLSPKTWVMVNYDMISTGDLLDAGNGKGKSVSSLKMMVRVSF